MKQTINIKAATFLILLSLFMLPLMGQGRGQGQGQGRGQMSEEDIEKRIDNLAETLECTDQQKEKLLEAELEWSRKMQTERAKYQGGGGDFDREAMRAKMQAERKLKDDKYKEILSDAQMKKYEELRAERMQQRQGQRPGEGGSQDSRGQRGRGRN